MKGLVVLLMAVTVKLSCFDKSNGLYILKALAVNLLKLLGNRKEPKVIELLVSMRSSHHSKNWGSK